MFLSERSGHSASLSPMSTTRSKPPKGAERLSTIWTPVSLLRQAARLERSSPQPREKRAEAIHPARLPEAQGQLVEGGDLDFGDAVEREKRASEKGEGGVSMGARGDE